jgi:superfamily II DNA or RNA helicase
LTFTEIYVKFQIVTGEQVKNLRKQLGLSQEAFAERLGVSFATVNRWENEKAKPQKGRIAQMQAMLTGGVSGAAKQLVLEEVAPSLNFEGEPEAIKLVVDAHRLRNGHQFNKAYGLELSRVVPLPHQRVAVYEHMLPQNPLRFLLADDAGAGKTVMTGLYIREMINRGRLRRALICCPAGLTWNWQRELRNFFDLEFRILRGQDFQTGDPLLDEHGLFIISVDTVATEAIRERLQSASGGGFDLVVFDEAHKLSWTDSRRLDTKTRRYRLAETLAKSTHLLLLTATPHMGKPFPYFALWRLLDSKIFSTLEALGAVAQEKRRAFFIRRLKEEMIDYSGQPIYKPRLCQTVKFELSKPEQDFYEESSDYLRWSFETNRSLNRNAAAMVVAVLQRRLASSTYAMVQSLKRRRERIVKEGPAESLPNPERLLELLDTATADESEPTETGAESQERVEEQAMALAHPQTEKQLETELRYLDATIGQGEAILGKQCETKFLKLRELVDSAEFQHERLLIFTEHRDTLEHLQQRFEALGYTGQIASIHGGMDVEERERQRVFFMPPAERRRQNLPNPDAPSARIMLATDAAGEGINLQFAWLMVNFDVPWNPARLEQRMGRLHRFGQRHDEVRIFNFVAVKTREGDVLATLLAKLDEARRELCTDKVFDVVGQQLQELSIRDLLRDALFETAPYSAQKQLDSLFATQRLRAAVEEQRRQASAFGDVAKRLGQLNTEIEVERFNRLLPAYVQNFVEKAAPRLGFEIEGDLNDRARLNRSSGSTWIEPLASHWRGGLPPYVSVRRDEGPGNGAAPTAFLRPGEPLFDAFCDETIRRFAVDARRGGFFLDPAAERPYFAAAYVCQLGERSLRSGDTKPRLMERRLLGLRWDGSGEFAPCAPNHLLALVGAPPALAWKAGALLQAPIEQVQRADAHARMVAETSFLQQARAAVRAESLARVEDLQRGFDFSAGEMAERRVELSHRARDGDAQAAQQLDLIKREQGRIEQDKAEALLYEHRRGDLLDIITLDRIAVALVIPDQSPEAVEGYDKNIEAIAMRIAVNYEVDRHRARVFDVSAPHLARGYDLESHRTNGEKIVIEVKGRSGRGVVHLTENEWPTAANVRDKYWLYVVTDCATEPRLYRVQDPVRLAFRTRQSFTLNIGDIIKEAETE